MPKTLTIEIPLLVGSNGKWSTMGPDEDWGLMADCIMDGSEDPEQSRRYKVRVTVDLPETVILGNAVAVETN